MERINHKSSGELQREVYACENIIKAQQEEITKITAEKTGSLPTNINKTIKEIESSINKRIDRLETKIEEGNNNKQITKHEPENKTYAGITKKQLETQSNDIKRLFEHERSEKRWIKATACNLILHRVFESTDDTKESLEKEDKKYMEKNVLRRLGLSAVEVVKTERIGTFTEEREKNNQYRPLKVTFQNKEDKNNVLKALCKRNYFDIGVTEDLSKTERNMVKEWYQKAKEKNKENENENFKWKVRGSPRTGLYLKKIYCI